MRVNRLIGGAVVAFLIALLLLSSFATVSPGHTGVRVTLGAVSSSTLTEGLHFKIPFVQAIKKMDNRVQKIEASCAAASKDLQTISSNVAVNIRLNPASSAEIYQSVGLNYDDKIILPVIQEIVKAVTAKYTAEELITKRQDVSEQMKELLQTKIKAYGLTVYNFNVINFDFSEEFSKAIEAKQTAQQMALKAEQDLRRVQVEAEQKVAQAQAEAEALRLQKQEITPELLQLRQIEVMRERWNGQMPTTVVIGDGSNTLLGIPIQ